MRPLVVTPTYQVLGYDYTLADGSHHQFHNMLRGGDKNANLDNTPVAYSIPTPLLNNLRNYCASYRTTQNFPLYRDEAYMFSH